MSDENEMAALEGWERFWSVDDVLGDQARAFREADWLCTLAEWVQEIGVDPTLPVVRRKRLVRIALMNRFNVRTWKAVTDAIQEMAAKGVTGTGIDVDAAFEYLQLLTVADFAAPPAKPRRRGWEPMEKPVRAVIAEPMRVPGEGATAIPEPIEETMGRRSWDFGGTSDPTMPWGREGRANSDDGWWALATRKLFSNLQSPGSRHLM